MSTIMSFCPMNLRLYDKEEQELRTFVSPIFDCVARAGDARGVCAHIAADNGGGKSTLLLFFEMLFCKPGASGPSVGRKKAIDYLRRAAFDLRDSTPTTMAALVRRDDPSLMRQARDVIFGYVAGLRGDEGKSLDIRRFAIHLSENPGFSLEQLATEVVYDDKGAARPMRDVWERLRALPGCHPYDGSDWEGYVREMTEAGISPILWRELAKMNAEEEAAGTYFHSGNANAFRNIVRLVSEAQEPVSGEQSKPLWDVAANIARQVATQSEDRERERRCHEAGESAALLAEMVGRYADEREALKQLEDHVSAGGKLLKEREAELGAQKHHLEDQRDGYRARRELNEQLRTSKRIVETQDELVTLRQKAQMRAEELERKKHALLTATRSLRLDDAARSYRRYKQFDAQYEAAKDRLEVLRGNIEASEELLRATTRAWRDLHRAEWSTDERVEQAKLGFDAARQGRVEAQGAFAEATQRWNACSQRQGAAQKASELALDSLQRIAGSLPALATVQTTLEGSYARQTIAGFVKAAKQEDGRAREALSHAQLEQRKQSEALAASRQRTADARVEHAESKARAEAWDKTLIQARVLDQAVRDSLQLWEEPVELVAVGRYAEARNSVEALRRAYESEMREAQDRAGYLQRRFDALEAGRLDMSDALRGWLDRHGIEARTLASYTGLPSDLRGELFDAEPWLAHVLVVDGGTAASLAGRGDDDELCDLGHPVFFVCQSDVQSLLESLADESRKDGSASVPRGAIPPVVHALHTLDRDYLDDPDAYVRRLEGELGTERQRAGDAERMVERTREGQDAVMAFANYVVTTDLGNDATLADIQMRTELMWSRLEEAARRASACEDEEHAHEERLRALDEQVRDAQRVADEAARRLGDTDELERRNDVCIQSARELAEAEGALQEADINRQRAESALGDARDGETRARGMLDDARRERASVKSLRASLEALASEESAAETMPSGRACSPDELAVSVGALRDIITRNNEDIGRTEADCETTQRRRDDERDWQRALRDGGTGESAITFDVIERWVPYDEVARRRMEHSARRARDDEDEASRASQAAQNEVELAERRVSDLLDDLRGQGLAEPLEVPDGYDYDAERRAIAEEERQNELQLRDAEANQRRVDVLIRNLYRLSLQVARDDGYRAKEDIPEPTLPNLNALETFVEDCERRADLCLGSIRKTERHLRAQASDTERDVTQAGESAVARDVRKSIESLFDQGVSWRSIEQVRRGLEDRFLQFKSMAATLKNKLRATDESVDDLVHRVVEEGYGLLDELHHLVMVSRVRIKEGKPQRTIDFRSRNQSLYLKETRRDEVATNRLERSVRTLLMEELPGLEEARRADSARARLEPHELVYLLQDDRSIEVKYPVLRGGRVLSYESARDVSGSGSTGQKSAGYVLAFLSLLRYLGSVGSLSSEKTLFVALENQFGKISTSKIIADIKEVVDQTHMQLITVAGRELRSAYAMGDVVFTLYRSGGTGSAHGSARAMRVRVNESDKLSSDAVIDKFRVTRQFETLKLDI